MRPILYPTGYQRWTGKLPKLPKHTDTIVVVEGQKVRIRKESNKFPVESKDLVFEVIIPVNYKEDEEEENDFPKVLYFEVARLFKGFDLYVDTPFKENFKPEEDHIYWILKTPDYTFQTRFIFGQAITFPTIVPGRRNLKFRDEDRFNLFLYIGGYVSDDIVTFYGRNVNITPGKALYEFDQRDEQERVLVLSNRIVAKVQTMKNKIASISFSGELITPLLARFMLNTFNRFFGMNETELSITNDWLPTQLVNRKLLSPLKRICMDLIPSLYKENDPLVNFFEYRTNTNNYGATLYSTKSLVDVKLEKANRIVNRFYSLKLIESLKYKAFMSIQNRLRDLLSRPYFTLDETEKSEMERLFSDLKKVGDRKGMFIECQICEKTSATHRLKGMKVCEPCGKKELVQK